MPRVRRTTMRVPRTSLPRHPLLREPSRSRRPRQRLLLSRQPLLQQLQAALRTSAPHKQIPPPAIPSSRTWASQQFQEQAPLSHRSPSHRLLHRTQIRSTANKLPPTLLSQSKPAQPAQDLPAFAQKKMSGPLSVPTARTHPTRKGPVLETHANWPRCCLEPWHLPALFLLPTTPVLSPRSARA